MAVIGIFDSGIGGLSVFREIRKILPYEDYIYFSDNANCPYGGKTSEFITDRARAITEMLIREGADIIVIACNTATAAAVATLREEYSHDTGKVSHISSGRIDHVMFIGMEPAIKPAISITKSGVVGVLATRGTLSGEKYKRSKEQFSDQVKIVEHIGEGFVELVEKGILEGKEVNETVSNSLKPLLVQGADVIVLGCTHYPFLLDAIRRIAGESTTVINPAPAVARQLARVIEEENIQLKADIQAESPKIPGTVVLKSSGTPENLNRFYELI